MMLMGYWSCAVQPGTAMTAHGDDEVRRHKGCRTFLLRPRARRPSDPELPPRRSKSTYTLSHPPETARRQKNPLNRGDLSRNMSYAVNVSSKSLADALVDKHLLWADRPRT